MVVGWLGCWGQVGRVAVIPYLNHPQGQGSFQTLVGGTLRGMVCFQLLLGGIIKHLKGDVVDHARRHEVRVLPLLHQGGQESRPCLGARNSERAHLRRTREQGVGGDHRLRDLDEVIEAEQSLPRGGIERQALGSQHLKSPERVGAPLVTGAELLEQSTRELFEALFEEAVAGVSSPFEVPAEAAGDHLERLQVLDALNRALVRVRAWAACSLDELGLASGECGHRGGSHG